MARPTPDVPEQFVWSTAEQARQLLDALVGVGASPEQAKNCVMSLVTDWTASGQSAADRRSRYRVLLKRLGAPPWEGSEAKVGELRLRELFRDRRRRNGRRPGPARPLSSRLAG
ncbi:MAG TPA: hypothetical protein VFP61_07535 [Acidimicrobiales bacterium]|nr:hypothetical protein [Acidimicrobiales bacterium]